MTGIDVRRDALDDRHFWAVTLLFCLALAWSIMPEGFSFGLESQESIDAQQGSALRRLQWLPLFAWGAGIVWVRRDVSLALLRTINPFLLAFLLWVALGMLWSPYPMITLRKVVLFGGVCVIALAFAVASWDRDRLIQLTRYVVTVLLLVSIVMVILMPDLAVGGPVGDEWKGATPSKNHLGKLAGIGLLLWIQAIAARKTRWRIALPALALSTGMLLMAQSASSLMSALPFTALVWFMLRPPLALPRHGLLVGVLFCASALAAVAFGYLIIYGIPDWQLLASPVAGAVGRNITLTGRFEIWQRILVEVGNHTWLGYGFGAFWLGADGPVPWITQNLYGILWQAHNGYLDLLNETGLIGLALGIGFLIFHILRAVTLAAYDRASAAAQLAIFGFLIVNNITESSIFRPINFLFYLSVVASLDLSRAHVDIALRRAYLRSSPVHRPRLEVEVEARTTAAE